MGYEPVRPARQQRISAGKRRTRLGWIKRLNTALWSNQLPAKASDSEKGSIMLDILIGLLLATVGLCLVLGSIALTCWHAGRTEQDTLKIIQTRNEKAKAEFFEITPETFKK